MPNKNRIHRRMLIVEMPQQSLIPMEFSNQTVACELINIHLTNSDYIIEFVFHLEICQFHFQNEYFQRNETKLYLRRCLRLIGWIN